jgi:hypothetical protein
MPKHFVPTGNVRRVYASAGRPLLDSAHLGAGQTYVIALGTNKVVATIRDTPGAEGVDYVPDLYVER